MKVKCEECGGTGQVDCHCYHEFTDVITRVTCEFCGGTGFMRQCPVCGDEIYHGETECESCHGDLDAMKR